MSASSIALLVWSLIAASTLQSTMFEDALTLCARLLEDVACLTAALSPEHIQARFERSEIAVDCDAEPREPLAGCSFRVWAVDAARDGPLMDVEADRSSSLTIHHPGKENAALGVVLQGGNFAKGRCSININGLEGVNVLVGCKITTKSKHSDINIMSVFFHNGRRFELDSYNKLLFVDPGDKVEVKLRTRNEDVKLRRCTSTMRNGDQVTVLPGSVAGGVNRVVSVPASDLYAALDSDGMDRGQCGFSVKNVTSADAGVVYVRAEALGGILVAAQALVIAVGTTFDTTMSLDKLEYAVGDNLTATCTITGLFRSLANARWMLDSRTLTNAKSEDFNEVGWSWPWQGATLSHSITLSLRRAGVAPCLACKVRQVTKIACLQWRQTTGTNSTPPTEDYTRTLQTAVYTSTSVPESFPTTAVEAWTHSTVAEEEPVASEIDAEDVDDTSSSFSGSQTGTLVVCNFILMVVIVLVACTVTIYAKLNRRWCFGAAAAQQDRRNSADTIYEEIPLDYLRARLPPCIPPLPVGWDELSAVPKELAPPPPGVSNPEYMAFLDKPKDDCCKDVEYMKPRYHDLK